MEINRMTEQIKIIAVLYNKFDTKTKELEFKLSNNSYWLSEDDIVLDENFAVFITPPNLNKQELMLKAIETLKSKQKVIRQDAYNREQALQNKIDSLLMITYIDSNNSSDNIIEDSIIEDTEEISTEEISTEEISTEEISTEDTDIPY